jgi:N6-L-threonylcarbamoyladenine synthase
MEDMFSMERLGGTTDDASWEAFDKVAKMMGLGYPGGPIISKLAWEYSWASSNLFPRVWLKKDEYDFSFSWLKSAVKREVDKRWKLSLNDKKEISFEFENAVTEVLTYKLINAWTKKRVWTVMLAWGVSANDKLISLIKDESEKSDLNFIYPIKKLYSWDNAAMVGINAYYKIKNLD